VGWDRDEDYAGVYLVVIRAKRNCQSYVSFTSNCPQRSSGKTENFGQPSDGIDRNGRLEHAQEATGEDELTQAAKVSKIITPYTARVSIFYLHAR
jgi:hypothetical protein